MARYDFRSLSPQDFEELVRDILQAQLNIPLESFKSGRDQGIDLRYTPADSGSTIIQCKHYAVSGLSSLLSNLVNSELPKIKLLQPARYIVVTSVPMSPNDKVRIVEALNPFIQSPSDIISAGDLEGLLNLHPAVERANFKLWLTSTEVISRVLHNAEHCTTDFQVDKIKRKLPVFVQSEAYPRAQALLDEQRVLVVSGPPGIGKTTLAEMILFAHVEQGFEPVVLQTDVIEGKRLFNRDTKQIFYYDDFLGQTFLGDQRGHQGRNQDLALLNFIEMVRDTERSRFILTTREHILRQALQMSERYSQSLAINRRCVLELNDYSFGRRARILYNHLYFSKLPPAHIEAVLKDDYFLEIVKHEHFNPRLVEWLSSLERLGSPTADNYRERIKELLQSPHDIWKHAYDNQLSDAGRDLILTLYTLGNWSSVEKIERPFEAIHRGNSDRYNRQRRATDFRSGLQELDGAFLTYRLGYATFLNPSIKDFVADIICKTPQIGRELLADSVYFRQFSTIWELAVARSDAPLLGALANGEAEVCNNARRLLATPSMEWELRNGRRFGHTVDSDEATRLGVLVEICNTLKSTQFLDLCAEYANTLVTRWAKDPIDFGSTLRLLETMGDSDWFFQNEGCRIYADVLDETLGYLDVANSDDWLSLMSFPALARNWLPSHQAKIDSALLRYKTYGLSEECDNCSDADELSAIASSLTELTKKFGVDFSSQMRDIEERMEQYQRKESDEDSDSNVPTKQWPGAKAEFVSEDDVRQMFSTLKD